ncbi:MAG: hypothetical protein GX654_05470 [Desulfatiglans sp.]|nr:hypothetical protein [Desulfatiglans sp.]
MIINIGGVQYGIGLPEFLIILVIFAIAVGIPLIVTLLLRKYVPQKLWIALLLGFILGPLGQFYFKKAWLYFISLLILEIILIVKQVNYGLLALSILSAGIMYLRFNKLKSHNI